MDEICKRLKEQGKCKPSDSCSGAGNPDGICCAEYMKEEKEEARKKFIASIPKRPKLIELKSDPPIFQIHWDNKKPFDLRETRDRKFDEGDVVIEREFDRGTQMYSGREIVYRILSIVRGPVYNLPEGNAIMGFHPCGIKTESNLKPRGEL